MKRRGFRSRHDGVLFDMSPHGEERAVLIRYRGIFVAMWRRDGRTLKLYSPPDQKQPVVEVKTTGDAFARTVSFVTQVLSKLGRDWPPPQKGTPTRPPKLGFLG